MSNLLDARARFHAQLGRRLRVARPIGHGRHPRCATAPEFSEMEPVDEGTPRGRFLRSA
jgi:hypothetical protein